MTARLKGKVALISGAAIGMRGGVRGRRSKGRSGRHRCDRGGKIAQAIDGGHRTAALYRRVDVTKPDDWEGHCLRSGSARPTAKSPAFFWPVQSANRREAA
jgi:hypothetical protein